MTIKNVIDKTITEESPVEENEKNGQVIPLFRLNEYNATDIGSFANPSYRNALSSREESTPYKLKKDFREKVDFDIARDKLEIELIENSYNLIVSSDDNEIDPIERSNCFDEWKDTLDNIIEDSKTLSINHKKIIGTIAISVKNKDLTDFNHKQMALLKDATYLLRQNRLSNSDSKRTIKNFIEEIDKLMLMLNVEGITDEEERELDTLMNDLIKRSKSK